MNIVDTSAVFKNLSNPKGIKLGKRNNDEQLERQLNCWGSGDL